jgi:hypothetical protein
MPVLAGGFGDGLMTAGASAWLLLVKIRRQTSPGKLSGKFFDQRAGQNIAHLPGCRDSREYAICRGQFAPKLGSIYSEIYTESNLAVRVIFLTEMFGSMMSDFTSHQGSGSYAFFVNRHFG